VQALAARHRVLLTRVGAPVHITTGRRLAAGQPTGLDDVLVMLDGKAAFKDLPDDDLDIYWGAYLGMPDEILISGDLQSCKAEIVRARAEARERKGWIMDTYLLRRRLPEADLA
jgi:precorrin-6A synthase